MTNEAGQGSAGAFKRSSAGDHLTQAQAITVQLGLIHAALDVVLDKRHDYGSQKDPYKNLRGAELLGISSVLGVLVRTMDKLMRLSVVQTGGQKIKTETAIDSLLDITNYAAIAAGLLAERDPVLLADLTGRAPLLSDRITELLTDN